MYSTRDKLLLALAKAPGRSLSGSVLARRLRLTRTSIWKQVKALKSEGFAIKIHPAQGYELEHPFDTSLLRRRQDVLGFWKCHYQFSVTSTQFHAKQAADTGTTEGQFWIAEKQTAGRGRLERAWESGLGGLWFSILLRPSLVPAQVAAFTLVAALGLAETIESETGVRTRLKWPNDVVVQTRHGWRKVAGILTEMSAEVDRVHWVVMGIGINVYNTLPEDLADRAISLSVLRPKLPTRADLLETFLKRFGALYRRFEKTGFEAFRKSYWQMYSRPDQAIRLKTSQGEVAGVARGVDARGALVVESHDQLKTIWEGEIII